MATINDVTREFVRKLEEVRDTALANEQEQHAAEVAALNKELKELRKYKEKSMINSLTVQIDRLQTENELLKKKLRRHALAASDTQSTYTASTVPAPRTPPIAPKQKIRPVVKMAETAPTPVPASPQLPVSERVSRWQNQDATPAQAEVPEAEAEPEVPAPEPEAELETPTPEPEAEVEEPAEQEPEAEAEPEPEAPAEPEPTPEPEAPAEPTPELEVEPEAEAPAEPTPEPEAEAEAEAEAEEDLWLLELDSGKYFWETETGNLLAHISDAEAGEVVGKLKVVKIKGKHYYVDTIDDSVYDYMVDTGEVGARCGTIVNKKFVRS